MPKSKAELEAKFKKITSDLRQLQQDFLNLRKRASQTIKSAGSRRDSEQVQEIRKKLGLS